MRVISTLTAVEMKKMLESVVLFGTGKKAILDGYTSAGKTGTAQKIDPATGAYSRSQYIASFAGFAPVNEPAVSVAVILDSPVGPHHGGDVAAPVFARVTQQVLAYMNVPHDPEITNSRRLMLRAAAKSSDEDTADSSPDRLGGTLEAAANDSNAEAEAAPATNIAQLRPAALKSSSAPSPTPGAQPQEHLGALQSTLPPQGTVVVDVSGGVIVPMLVGKPVRAALETAQEAGIEIDVIGSGVAREQSAPPGSRIATGTRVAVRFSR
jgi:cell division protein FtsI (penicillin-binding protein 3)